MVFTDLEQSGGITAPEVFTFANIGDFVTELPKNGSGNFVQYLVNQYFTPSLKLRRMKYELERKARSGRHAFAEASVGESGMVNRQS